MYTTSEIVKDNAIVIILAVVVSVVITLFFIFPITLITFLLGLEKKRFLILYSSLFVIGMFVLFRILTAFDGAIIYDIDDWHRQCGEYIRTQNGCGG